MRELSKSEKTKRGCHWCADKIPPRRTTNVSNCPHAECPYHELDGFKSYEEYLRKSKKGGLGRLLEELSKKL